MLIKVFYTTTAGDRAQNLVKTAPRIYYTEEGFHAVEAIQVSSYVADEKTRQRELRALTEIRAELKTGAAMAATPELFMTVITDDEAGLIETMNGDIRITPLWKWLPG